MLIGKPTIATAYSGKLDFMNSANSYLVNYHLVEIPETYGPYEKGWTWAEQDDYHAAHLMRKVYENREEAQEIAQQGRKHIIAHLNLSAVGQRIKKNLIAAGRLNEMAVGSSV